MLRAPPSLLFWPVQSLNSWEADKLKDLITQFDALNLPDAASIDIPDASDALPKLDQFPVLAKLPVDNMLPLCTQMSGILKRLDVPVV